SKKDIILGTDLFVKLKGIIDLDTKIATMQYNNKTIKLPIHYTEKDIKEENIESDEEDFGNEFKEEYEEMEEMDLYSEILEEERYNIRNRSIYEIKRNHRFRYKNSHYAV